MVACPPFSLPRSSRWRWEVLRHGLPCDRAAAPPSMRAFHARGSWPAASPAGASATTSPVGATADEASSPLATAAIPTGTGTTRTTNMSRARTPVATGIPDTATYPLARILKTASGRTVRRTRRRVCAPEAAAASAKGGSAEADCSDVYTHPSRKPPRRGEPSRRSRAGSKSTSAIERDRLASARPIPRPMPLAPPVMTATLPAISRGTSVSRAV